MQIIPPWGGGGRSKLPIYKMYSIEGGKESIFASALIAGDSVAACGHHNPEQANQPDDFQSQEYCCRQGHSSLGEIKTYRDCY